MEEGKKAVAVIGAGKSGISSASLLLKLHERVILYDGNPKADRERILNNFEAGSELELFIGDFPIERDIYTAVISPGVPVDSPLVQKIKDKGIAVIGEMELAYRNSKGMLLAVTGTNGKTTTTTLLGEIMKKHAASSGQKVYVVGNIGNPFSDIALDTDDNSILVSEVSSFQLETMDEFHPRAAAVLNVTPDHLDRHHSMENYVAAKRDIGKRLREGDSFVLNYDDEYTRSFAEGSRADIVYFSQEAVYGDSSAGKLVWLKDGAVIDKSGQKTGVMDGRNRGSIFYGNKEILPLSGIRILGRHNVYNVMAAAAMAISVGVPIHTVAESIREFKGVEHRLEFVRTVDGVDYYNDSKGTNPDASIKAVEAMVKKTLLIGGGYDKKIPYDDWILSFKDRVRMLFVFGETAGEIEECCKSHGFHSFKRVSGLKEAVEECHKEALPGEAVLLSPASASWDMFKNYEERGELFKEYVRAL
ncbi:MAG: UDP-N-acetylmuramoyl-L-alanine--D-glutamate ligase [Lachnospiraceae bacterium]|nr:UDP-N-acetylmuramoyl-L-alanine--D-glutamate ligase [Lachnospiraceae bacterium]